MKKSFLRRVLLMISLMLLQKGYALSSGEVSVRLISGYFWVDNSCTAAGPKGKVVSFRVKNTKGVMLQGVTLNLGSIGFTAAGAASYTSGTPSFTTRTSSSVYLGNIAAGDSATAFFFVGYNCLLYPNNTNMTTDYLTLPVTVSDMNPGTVSASFTKNIYVLRNSNNNTITVLATTANLVGTMLTISVAYNISNVKPGNIIDMELSTTNTFPAGYSILGCKFTASSIADFPVNGLNTHYANSIVSNLPSGGTVTIEWYLKINSASTGISSSSVVPYVVSDAGSSQRWQANTTSFTGTATPTNSISIAKRVNKTNVGINDTVSYTIVIKNSSAVADIAIDRLVDDLPRDYQFRYMESNTSVFPRLVTYVNSTAYPPFQDTNYLYFSGRKELSAGIFSWVVPKQDSIKLIYSVRVSSLPGFNDTNFITAYVGPSSVGTSFAKVNVFASLPVHVTNFNVERVVNGCALSWRVTGDNEYAHYRISRETETSGTYVTVAEFDDVNSNREYYYMDHCGMNTLYYNYKLEKSDKNGHVDAYFASVETGVQSQAFSATLTDGMMSITGINPAVQNIYVIVNDMLGRILFDNHLTRTDNSGFLIPYDFFLENGSCVIVTVEYSETRSSTKIVLN